MSRMSSADRKEWPEDVTERRQSAVRDGLSAGAPFLMIMDIATPGRRL
jgi:hypothetical protein